ncbi:MAG TPA: cadherin [Oribacterium sp.]|nr:cadherin [Oribacterium sp.]
MTRFFKKAGILLLSIGMLTITPAQSLLTNLHTTWANQAVIRGSNVNVRSAAGTNSAIVTSLAANSPVSITGQQTGSDGKLWYQISFNGGSGFVRSDFIRLSVNYATDPNFEAALTQQGFPESYKVGLRQLHAQYPNWIFTAKQTGLDWNQAVAAELEGTNSLIESSSKSSWKSTDSGKYDWLSSSWPGFDGATWVAASKEIVSYYMDPRNFLDDRYIFQFNVHKFNPSIQTIDGLRAMLQGTFLAGNVSIDSSSPLYQTALQAQNSQLSQSAEGLNAIIAAGANQDEAVIDYSAPGAALAAANAGGTTTTTAGPVPGTSNGAVVPSITANSSNPSGVNTNGSISVSYADIIMEAAQLSQENPYVLAAMILQEQGKSGTSGSISGSSGYYNYFNIGAYAANEMSAVERGIWYASQSGNYNRPWNTPERAIIGGAMFYAENFLNAGQDTLYLKRFNVQGSNIFKHQYMTNTQGAAEEGAYLSEAYGTASKNLAQEFSIPVYNNMPENACPIPTGDGSPNNKLGSLSVNGFTLTPGFNMDTANYTLIVDPSVSQVTISAQALHNAASIAGTGTVSLTGASTSIPISVTAQNGSVRQYVITINKQTGGQTDPYSAASGYSSSDSSADQTSGASLPTQESTQNASSVVTNIVEVGVGPL